MTKPNNEKMSLGARQLIGVNGIADIGSNSDSFRIRFRTWFFLWILVESSVRTGAENCSEFDIG
jgi:hypothetical protein